ncbi:hypothetical protein [Candidatus Frankia alpina]|uniref:hypothetical protein n=1 Tax=Candidatus Frankia alpina TaxID=2699483 RepID=UPI001F2D1E3B|nr:hypothetical protein [Candidatus Frankia alpina]
MTSAKRASSIASVDFPAPDGPTSASHRARPQRRADAAQDDVSVRVAEVDVVELHRQRGAHRTGTSGFEDGLAGLAQQVADAACRVPGAFPQVLGQVDRGDLVEQPDHRGR